MKVAFKSKKTGKWKNVIHVKNMSVTEKFIIFTMLDGNVKVMNRDNVKYMRQTKLYER